MLDPARQLELRERPPGRSVMRQNWRDLLFLHYACDPEEVAALLPPGLEVDVFPDAEGCERAWIGFVPFRMLGVRWSFAPPVPGTHSFPETNVRTYVHRRGRDPGVWFFSLDAANLLAVRTARRFFHLPYFLSRMTAERHRDEVSYTGDRSGVRYQVSATVGEHLALPEPGTLEFFLLERYLLYAPFGSDLRTGRVYHSAYRPRSVTLYDLEERLSQAAGLSPRPFAHALFVDGVDVEVFPLRR